MDTPLSSEREYSAISFYIDAVRAVRRGECEQTQAGNLLSGIECDAISRWYILCRFFVTTGMIEQVAGRRLGEKIA